MVNETKLDEKVYLLNNDSKRILKINGIRLMIGLNRMTAEQVSKLEASPYFKAYFENEDAQDKLNWAKGFSPKDHRMKEIVDLPLAEAKKIIKDVFDISFLKDLEISCRDAKIKDLITEQMKAVLPSDKEIR